MGVQSWFHEMLWVWLLFVVHTLTKLHVFSTRRRYFTYFPPSHQVNMIYVNHSRTIKQMWQTSSWTTDHISTYHVTANCCIQSSMSQTRLTRSMVLPYRKYDTEYSPLGWQIEHSTYQLSSYYSANNCHFHWLFPGDISETNCIYPHSSITRSYDTYTTLTPDFHSFNSRRLMAI